VYDVLEYLAAGMTVEQIVADFPELTEANVRAALKFAADRERASQRLREAFTRLEHLTDTRATFAWGVPDSAHVAELDLAQSTDRHVGIALKEARMRRPRSRMEVKYESKHDFSSCRGPMRNDVDVSPTS